MEWAAGISGTRLSSRGCSKCEGPEVGRGPVVCLGTRGEASVVGAEGNKGSEVKESLDSMRCMLSCLHFIG